uniref:Uncharacterized protein n=1 Tax=Arundo donax TaxID=35708 RepID=A0A0A9HRC2_ARUDO
MIFLILAPQTKCMKIQLHCCHLAPLIS